MREDWWVVIPVRTAGGAKSRLSTRPAPQRVSLAIAFARDTISAALACPRVASVVVVGDAPALDALEALEALQGFSSVADPALGLNDALRLGASAVPAQGPVAALMADLPCLTADILALALDEASTRPRAFVCDAEGIGTTMLTALDPSSLAPRFGGRSRAAHAASGACEIADLRLGPLRRDVDSEVDLWDAQRIGPGPATREALS